MDLKAPSTYRWREAKPMKSVKVLFEKEHRVCDERPKESMEALESDC